MTDDEKNTRIKNLHGEVEQLRIHVEREKQINRQIQIQFENLQHSRVTKEESCFFCFFSEETKKLQTFFLFQLSVFGADSLGFPERNKKHTQDGQDICTTNKFCSSLFLESHILLRIQTISLLLTLFVRETTFPVE